MKMRQDGQSVVSGKKTECYIYLKLPDWVSKMGAWLFWRNKTFIFHFITFDDVLMSHYVTLLN